MEITHVQYRPESQHKYVTEFMNLTVGTTTRQKKLRCKKCYGEGRTYSSIPGAVVNKNYHRKQPNYKCPHGIRIVDENGYIITYTIESDIEKKAFVGRRSLKYSDVRLYFIPLRNVSKKQQACERCGRVLDETLIDKKPTLVSIDVGDSNAAVFLCCSDCAEVLQYDDAESTPDLMDWLRFTLHQFYIHPNEKSKGMEGL